MNRNDIAGILAGLELTDAQVKGLLDLNSADITKALNRQKDDLTAAKLNDPPKMVHRSTRGGAGSLVQHPLRAVADPQAVPQNPHRRQGAI